MRRTPLGLVLAVVTAFVWVTPSVRVTPIVSEQAGSSGLPSTRNGEWTHYTADARASQYSPLDRINGSNFNKLEVTWCFKTDNLGRPLDTSSTHGEGDRTERQRGLGGQWDGRL
jgi:glucose dehydrogenase